MLILSPCRKRSPFGPQNLTLSNVKRRNRMVEEGFYLQRINNDSPAKRSDIYTNIFSEWWSIVGQVIERRAVIVPNCEKLVSQLSSRRKLYDSKGRERLESKADLASRGVESPDRADALIGAYYMLGIGSDPYALNPVAKEAMHEMMDQTIRKLERTQSPFAEPHVNWELM